MVNEFGIGLDRNGYAPSLFETGRCYYCMRTPYKLDRHEIFHGNAYRKKSKELGLWVNLCTECHDALHHRNGTLDRDLKKRGQLVAMEHFGWTTDEFRSRFARNYI